MWNPPGLFRVRSLQTAKSPGGSLRRGLSGSIRLLRSYGTIGAAKIEVIEPTLAAVRPRSAPARERACRSPPNE